MSTTTYAATEERRDAVRVPLDEPRTLFDKAVAWYCRKNCGDVPDNTLALMHNRKALKALFGFEKKVAKWDALDPDLKILAQAVSASVIGCSWCMDFGHHSAHSQGLDTSKLGDIPSWREVTDEMAEALRTDLGNEPFIELTMMVAVENERSRMNSALGLTSQGFKDHCELRP